MGRVQVSGTTSLRLKYRMKKAFIGKIVHFFRDGWGVSLREVAKEAPFFHSKSVPLLGENTTKRWLAT